MDPLTQGVLGAALPQASVSRKAVVVAGIFGFLSGMSADLDVFIRSSTDPLLFLEYHRQFTHSLIFIPLGGLLCAVVLHALFGRRAGLGFKQSYIFCTLGYATHAVLDACTTYGTMLFWPFSDARIAWNVISIVDPLLTLPMLTLVVLAGIKRRPVFARAALVWGLSYMGLGLLQRNEAMDMGYEIARARGHNPVRLEAKPSFANLLVWKIVYETQDKFYVDAVRARLSPTVFQGSSVDKIDVSTDLPWLDTNSQQAKDIERFRWFSNGYIALDPYNDKRIIDIRYSLVPNEIAPLWSIELRRDAGPLQHVTYMTHRDLNDEKTATMRAMVMGGN